MTQDQSSARLAQYNRFLADQVFALAERIREMQSAVETAQAEPARLHADLAQRQEYLDAATGEVERLRAVVEEMRGELDGLKAEKESATAERHALEKRCAELEGRLASAGEGGGFFGRLRRGK
ncbi:MAG: hypothetical protein RL885_03675 [Planctomycetota bacterium]